MKHLRYKGGSDVRSFDPESLKRLEVDEDSDLVWDKRQGGVLEVKNATADKLLEVYPNDFEEVDSDQAEQLQMQVDGPMTDVNSAPTDASATDTAEGAGARTARSSTRRS